MVGAERDRSFLQAVQDVVAVVAVGCDKLAGSRFPRSTTISASAGTPGYVMFLAAVAARQRNAATVDCRRSRPRGYTTYRRTHSTSTYGRTHSGVPALAEIVVDCGERGAASLAHPTSTSTSTSNFGVVFKHARPVRMLLIDTLSGTAQRDRRPRLRRCQPRQPTANEPAADSQMATLAGSGTANDWP